MAGSCGSVNVAGRHIRFKIDTADSQLIHLSISNRESRIASEQAFMARHAQLKLATARSAKALEEVETDVDATVGDVGMLYLEQLKLRKELLAMETTTHLTQSVDSKEITLTPGEWFTVPDVGLVSWIPAAFNTAHTAHDQTTKKRALGVAFEKGTASFTFSELDE